MAKHATRHCFPSNSNNNFSSKSDRRRCDRAVGLVDTAITIQSVVPIASQPGIGLRGAAAIIVNNTIVR
jgi:hypothetical protein